MQRPQARRCPQHRWAARCRWSAWRCALGAGLWLVMSVLSSCAETARVLRLGGLVVGSAFHGTREVPNKLERVAEPRARLAVTWVGHATAVLQLDDKFVLTDPVFTPTVGQVSRRIVEPGVEVSALPQLDAVLISHLHFDHLSLGSLDLVEHKVRQLILPRGGSIYVPRSRLLPTELSAHERWQHDGLVVTAVPVRHLGWRFGLDQAWMTTSYTGYVIEYHGLKVYFGGDTAYDATLFRSIGERYGPFDLVLLPIGPIEPRDYICRAHTNPEEALSVFQDLGGRVLVPIHYDTFVDSLDQVGDATRRLDREVRRRGLPTERVVVLSQGERRVLTWRHPSPPRGAP